MFYRLFMFFTWIFIIVVCFLFSFGRCIFDKSPEEYDTWDKDPIDYNINSGSSSVKDTTLNKQENENKNKENVSPEKASANADIDIFLTMEAIQWDSKTAKKVVNSEQASKTLTTTRNLKKATKTDITKVVYCEHKKKEEYNV